MGATQLAGKYICNTRYPCENISCISGCSYTFSFKAVALKQRHGAAEMATNDTKRG